MSGRNELRPAGESIHATGRNSLRPDAHPFFHTVLLHALIRNVLTARDRPYSTTNRLAKPVYSRGDPLRSPCWPCGRPAGLAVALEEGLAPALRIETNQHPLSNVLTLIYII